MGPDADDDMDIDEDFDEADIEVNEDGEPEMSLNDGFRHSRLPPSRLQITTRTCRTKLPNNERLLEPVPLWARSDAKRRPLTSRCKQSDKQQWLPKATSMSNVRAGLQSYLTIRS